jgi:hypothetical protein
MSQTKELFEKPQRKRRVMMKVYDATDGGAVFECRKCHNRTGWMQVETITAARHGLSTITIWGAAT